MARCLKFNAIYTLSTSPDPRHHTTLLNAHFINCYITLTFLIATNYLTTELVHSKLKYGLFSTMVSCHNRSVQNCHNLCLKCARVYGHKQHQRLTY